MSEKQEPETIEFGRRELDPVTEENYKKKIARAQDKMSAVKGHTPIGHVARPPMPMLANRTGNIAELPSGLTQDGGVSPRPPGSPSIRPETADQVKAFQEAQKEDSSKKVEEETRKEIEASVDDIVEAFDTGPRNEAELILVNRKRRKEIESRLQEMEIEDLILKGEVQQSIPIIPGKFTIVLRSTLPEESLFVKRMIAKETVVSDHHTLEKYGLLQLCCALVAVNGRKFPSHMDDKGSNEELFIQKFNQMMKLSGYVITDMMVQLRWFDIRVRRLMNPELLGNG